MTTAVQPRLHRAVRRAAVAATRAPSALHTQPWRIVIRRDSLEIHADRSRQLRRLDADRRQLLFSCGSALTNVALALSADGLGSRIVRLPDARRRDLVATAHVAPGEPPAHDPLAAAARLSLIDKVHETPPRAEGAPIAVLASRSVVAVPPDSRPAVEALVRESLDRVRVDPSAHSEVQHLLAALAPEPVEESALGVVVSDDDSPAGWVRAGEDYQAMALEYALTGAATSPLMPVTAYPDLRRELSSLLGTDAAPQLLFRVRAGPDDSPRRRRLLVDTLVEGS